MSKTLHHTHDPFLQNNPVFKRVKPFTPDLAKKTLTGPELSTLIENTPKLKNSEVLVVNVKV